MPLSGTSHPPSAAPGNRVVLYLEVKSFFLRNAHLIQIEHLSGDKKTFTRECTSLGEIVCYFVVVEKRTFHPFLQSPTSPFSRQREKPGMTLRGRAEF